MSIPDYKLRELTYAELLALSNKCIHFANIKREEDPSCVPRSTLFDEDNG